MFDESPCIHPISVIKMLSQNHNIIIYKNINVLERSSNREIHTIFYVGPHSKSQNFF